MSNIHSVNLFIKHPKDKTLLAVRRADSDTLFGGMYAMPGGRVEPGESIWDVAERELWEETGAELKTVADQPLLTSPLEVGGKIYTNGVFEAEIKSSKFAPHDREIVEVGYIKPEFLIKSLKKHKYPMKEVKRLEAYFVESKFMVPAFDRIREIVSQIPEGKVATYGQIAKLAGLKDVRKVGWAIKGNTDPAIPCHRVVKKDGELALNYTLGNWKEDKAKLVLEGIGFLDETHVDLAKFQWDLSK